jgi:hypothetical protein
MRTDPAEILEAAADLYESEKIEWCKGAFYNSRTPAESSSSSIVSACAWGAIIHAATEDDYLSFSLVGGEVSVLNDPPYKDMRRGLNRALRAVRMMLEPELPEFNDTIAKDKQEIIDLFKETAKDLRNAA